MPVLMLILWTLVGGTGGGPVQQSSWSPDLLETPSFFHLPMFQHVAGPLVSRELFRPAAQRRPLPAELISLLLPATRPQHSRGAATGVVQVWCGISHISVRVDRLQLHAWTQPSGFRLGSCQVTRASPRFLYFHYRLTECGAEAEVSGGKLVYTFAVRFTPPTQGLVLRAVPLQLPIQCHYNRFHYSYQVGFRPQVQYKTFMKSIRSKLSFSLTVCNAQWEPLPPGQWFFLGDPVYFVAQTGALLGGEKLYVDSCHATTSKDPNSLPKVEIITNGCIIDSKREGSSSRFLLRKNTVVKFSVDAFLFREVSQMLYLHCSVSVSLTTSRAAMLCNYNAAVGKWEALERPSSCPCCVSSCIDKQNSLQNTASSSGWIIKQMSEEESSMRAIPFQSEEGRHWVHQEENRDEKMNMYVKDNTFPLDSEIGYWEEKGPPSEWTSIIPAVQLELLHIATGSLQGHKQTSKKRKELVIETAESHLKQSDKGPVILTEQMKTEENEVAKEMEIPRTTMSLSIKSSNSNTLRPGSSTNIMAATKNFNLSTNDMISSDFSTETSSPYNVSATVNTSGFISVWDSPDQKKYFEMDLRGLLNVRMSGEGKMKSDKIVESLLWSEQYKAANKSVATKSDRTAGQSGCNINSKGSHEDDKLCSLEITGQESDLSAHPAGLNDPMYKKRLPGESDFDSQLERGKTFHLRHLNGAISTLHSDHSGSENSEHVHENGPSHSAILTVITTIHGSESSHISDKSGLK